MSKTWVYKASSVENEIHGVKCAAKIIPISERDAYLEDGWASSPQEVKSGEVHFTREDLENKADELGITFDKRIKDKTLLERIKQQLSASKVG